MALANFLTLRLALHLALDDVLRDGSLSAAEERLGARAAEGRAAALVQLDLPVRLALHAAREAHLLALLVVVAGPLLHHGVGDAVDEGEAVLVWGHPVKEPPEVLDLAALELLRLLDDRELATALAVPVIGHVRDVRALHADHDLLATVTGRECSRVDVLRLLLLGRVGDADVGDDAVRDLAPENGLPFLVLAVHDVALDASQCSATIYMQQILMHQAALRCVLQ